MAFLLEIVSPQNTIFSGQVEKLTIPALTGQITVLTHHLPVFTPLNAGKVKYTTTAGKQNQVEIGKGMVEVQKNKVILLIEPPMSADKIVEAQAVNVQEKSQKLKAQVVKPSGVIGIEDAFRRSFIDFKEVRRKKRFQPFPSSEQPG